MATVSVLLPAYNCEPYVEAALSSLREQTFSDWEAVAVDDASSDRTPAILEEWSRRDPRIRFHRNAANLGMTANWNRCLSLAKGDLVIKLDADDVLRPGTLALLTEALQAPEVIGAGTRTLACNRDLEPMGGLPADDAILRAGIDPYKDHVIACEQWYLIAAAGHQLWHSCAFMLRRDVLTRLGGFDERFGCASDTDLLWRVLEQPARFAHRGAVGVLYRLRSGSTSDVFRANQWLSWEGVVGNLASLSRWRRTRRLTHFLRLRYVELWNSWKTLRRNGGEPLPPEVFGRLSSVAEQIAPPPFRDRLLFNARRAATRFM